MYVRKLVPHKNRGTQFTECWAPLVKLVCIPQLHAATNYRTCLLINEKSERLEWRCYLITMGNVSYMPNTMQHTVQKGKICIKTEKKTAAFSLNENCKRWWNKDCDIQQGANHPTDLKHMTSHHSIIKSKVCLLSIQFCTHSSEVCSVRWQFLSRWWG